MSININNVAKKKNTYDAIVVGSGMSGGWAAKEFCEKKMKTLVLERGGRYNHIEDYTTSMVDPWKFPHRNNMTEAEKEANPIQSKCYAWNEGTKHLFVKDQEHPYQQVKPFDWVRGYHVGGKSIMWARQCYRLGEHDFRSNTEDGNGNEWPIGYQDLAPWYSYVEKFAGISGNRDGLPQIPDGEFLPPMELNAAEKHFKQKAEARYPNRKIIIGRTANHTAPVGEGRGPCRYRHLCHRGCPFSGYFSSNSATLPAAERTGKLTLKTDSIVHSIIYDEKLGKATGVRVIDALTKETTEYYAKVIFVCAATLNSTWLLLNSTSNRFQNGLGNDGGVLGHYLVDHNYRVRVSAKLDGFLDRYYSGRRPNGFYIPRFRNFGSDKQKDFLRGYATYGECTRSNWSAEASSEGLGADFKKMLSEPGGWNLFMVAQGEMLPHFDNKVSLNYDKKDQWGLPTLDIDCEWKANEDAMAKDIMKTLPEMLEPAGFKDIYAWDSHQAPGLGIHEMGTCRMGKDPKTSMLNGWNQVHTVKNVFVTDGSSMPSQGCQNPSVTFMALTARAVDYAMKEMKKRNI
jgi:choline dehydrogenase-like flavoprotein